MGNQERILISHQTIVYAFSIWYYRKSENVDFIESYEFFSELFYIFFWKSHQKFSDFFSFSKRIQKNSLKNLQLWSELIFPNDLDIYNSFIYYIVLYLLYI